jgi:hypothetical protein
VRQASCGRFELSKAAGRYLRTAEDLGFTGDDLDAGYETIACVPFTGGAVLCHAGVTKLAAPARRYLSKTAMARGGSAS